MINKILDDLIQEAMEHPFWKAASALRCAKKELLEKIDFCGKWVSVKDRLPERPENWPHCEIKRCYFLVALESGCVKSLGFDFADMRWHTTGSPVTHWMPLPEPPKEGKHDG